MRKLSLSQHISVTMKEKVCNTTLPSVMVDSNARHITQHTIIIIVFGLIALPNQNKVDPIAKKVN